jgi:hypothetical protein
MYFLLQGRRINQEETAMKKVTNRASLLFDPEDGYDMFL